MSHAIAHFSQMPKIFQAKYLPDGVASPETNPLRDGAVLLLRLSKLLLGTERLVALFRVENRSYQHFAHHLSEVVLAPVFAQYNVYSPIVVSPRKSSHESPPLLSSFVPDLISHVL